jgi:hypothetical protein
MLCLSTQQTPMSCILIIIKFNSIQIITYKKSRRSKRPKPIGVDTLYMYTVGIYKIKQQCRSYSMHAIE